MKRRTLGRRKITVEQDKHGDYLDIDGVSIALDGNDLHILEENFEMEEV